mgnify:CR=1 FL=1
MSTLETNLIQPSTGTTLTLGASGDTVTVPSGATLTASGHVLQVVHATHNSEATSSSTSYADTGLTATITPSSSSNKVLVIVNQNGLEKDNADIKMQGKLLRGSTDLGAFIGDETLNTSTSNRTDMGGTGFSYLDSPSTTSATVYKTQFRNVSGSGNVAVQNGSAVSSITLMEIAG